MLYVSAQLQCLARHALLRKSKNILNAKNLWQLKFNNESYQYMIWSKVLMQGKLIAAVAYTLRTKWNQFSLGGLCKQE